MGYKNWKGLRDHLAHPFPNCVLEKSRSQRGISGGSDSSNRLRTFTVIQNYMSLFTCSYIIYGSSKYKIWYATVPRLISPWNSFPLTFY